MRCQTEYVYISKGEDGGEYTYSRSGTGTKQNTRELARAARFRDVTWAGMFKHDRTSWESKRRKLMRSRSHLYNPQQVLDVVQARRQYKIVFRHQTDS